MIPLHYLEKLLYIVEVNMKGICTFYEGKKEVFHGLAWWDSGLVCVLCFSGLGLVVLIDPGTINTEHLV